MDAERPASLPGLLENHRAFLQYFERRVGDRARAEDILQDAADRAYEAFARELGTHERPTADTEAEICACVSRLAATLKPEYAEALEAIEVAGTPVKTFAEQKGLSSNNAGECRNCTCTRA